MWPNRAAGDVPSCSLMPPTSVAVRLKTSRDDALLEVWIDWSNRP
jgi:hypothetical protein